ncbi:MAG: prolyl oligopeptidase family serine peptidase [Anaerolineae bacterium]|nr:prolyl oligopeptidase family serine peptidase [Anaerolineae bacterium]
MHSVPRDRQYWLRLARLALVAIIAGAIGTLVGLVLFPSAIYAHYLTHPGCGEMGLTPADVGIAEAEDVTYSSHDGLTLRAWYLPPQNGAVVILLPGLGGAREGMLHEGAILARHGYGLLLTEMRSCADPEGLGTLGYWEAADLVQAAAWVHAQPGVAHAGVLGYSQGGVTAILGAAREPQIEAVVAEGGFYDLTGDILNEGGNDPLWNMLTYRAVLFFFRRETGIDAHDISPISVIQRISPRPLLLIYGDREVEAARPQEQIEQAREPKELWIVPNCGHGEYLNVAAEEWEERVVAFFDQAFQP